MAAHHVEAPEQVVTPGEELWVKIIDIDLDRRRISLSIKQAAEGGEVAAEYREHFGEQNFDEQGQYIGPEAGEQGDAGATPPPEAAAPEPAVPTEASAEIPGADTAPTETPDADTGDTPPAETT
jgi:small subunit ribosomal protein S1